MRRVRGSSDLVQQLPRTEAALAFAELRHAGQLRKVDGAPFIEHPVEVASLLFKVGEADDVIAAGLLHDTLEKTSTDIVELRKQFGSRTAGIVAALSEDESISGYATRKAALRHQVEAAGRDAMMVFAADKVSKVRELAVEPSGSEATRLAATVSRTRQRRLLHYRRCLELLERHLADSPLVEQLRAELELRTTVPARHQALAGAA